MINLKDILDDARLLTETGAGGHIKHLFEDGNLTFADLRDIFSKVFSGDMALTEKIDGISLLVTYKDGKFKAARSGKTLRDPLDYSKLTAKYCDSPEELREAFANSMKDLEIALSELDQMELNRYFANGRNFLNCEIVYPPCSNVLDYGNRCFIVLHGLKCYDDKYREVGNDEEQAKTLFDKLLSNEALNQRTFELTEPNILRLKNVIRAKTALDEILSRLQKFIDGVGWKCSISQYVRDKYASLIVNKALEHGVDVSKSSDFVRALAERLSQVSGIKPTKSDLMTYAKCDGVNCRSPEYKAFIDELENNADQTNFDIMRPIEDLIIYAGVTLMKNVAGFMSLDPSMTAKRALAKLDDAIMKIKENEFELTPETIARFKRNLAKIDKYCETIPAEGVVFRWKGNLYKMTGAFGGLNQICGIVKYK